MADLCLDIMPTFLTRFIIISTGELLFGRWELPGSAGVDLTLLITVVGTGTYCGLGSFAVTSRSTHTLVIRKLRSHPPLDPLSLDANPGRY